MPSPPLLVTGAAGFIGARFCERAALEGVEVVSVDKSEHFDSRPEHRTIERGTRVDRRELAQWLEHAPPLRGILHLGACTDTTLHDLERFRRDNLEASQRLWSFAAQRGVPLVYASSAATYGDGTHGYDDDEARIPDLAALNPYGDSKQQFDLWALERERRGEAPPAWSAFKFFNVYGFGERHKKRMASVVLQTFDQIRERGSMRLFRSHHPDFADGHQSRDFIFVDDVVDVLWFALTKPIARGIFNLGTGRARTFLDLARATFASVGTPEAIEFIDTPKDLQSQYQYFTQATMQRLRDAGYERPFTSLEDGVAATVARLQAEARS